MLVEAFKAPERCSLLDMETTIRRLGNGESRTRILGFRFCPIRVLGLPLYHNPMQKAWRHECREWQSAVIATHS